MLLEQIDAERDRLRSLLDRMPASTVAQRPPDGTWSVLENVRHLLFAEQLHVGRLVVKAAAWSPLGFTPVTMREMRKLPPVEGEDIPRLADVLSAWDDVHKEIVSHFSDVSSEDLQRALDRNLKHLRAHVRVIERLARNAAK